MQKVIALNNQTLFDLCIQVYGNLKPLFEFAKANEISITENLVIGKEYIVPYSNLANVEIVNFYKNRKLTPATALPIQRYSAGGIGEMIIGSTFIIE